MNKISVYDYIVARYMEKTYAKRNVQETNNRTSKAEAGSQTPKTPPKTRQKTKTKVYAKVAHACVGRSTTKN